MLSIKNGQEKFFYCNCCNKSFYADIVDVSEDINAEKIEKLNNNWQEHVDKMHNGNRGIYYSIVNDCKIFKLKIFNLELVIAV